MARIGIGGKRRWRGELGVIFTDLLRSAGISAGWIVLLLHI
jgi:hypothetical protein